MDWFSWLSKTRLDPSLVYEYGLLLFNNELEEDDVGHFDHEFLQSMGISIAKHRLEILKLARKEKARRSPLPIARLLDAVRKTKGCLIKCMRSLVRRRERSALVVVPRPSLSSRRGNWLKRSKRLLFLKQGRFVLTDGGVKIAPQLLPPPPPRSSSPMISGKGEEDDDGFWGSAAEYEIIRWDSMFQDLKPT